jgi:deazaflavin-dependent oxidoreductase (nitroreductase family)
MTIPITDPTPSRLTEPIRRLIRATNPLLRPLAGTRWFRLWGVIHHRGRKSGTPYATPVVVRSTGDGFVIPMPFGDRTNWAANIIAAGGGTIRWAGADHRVTDPRLVSEAEAAPAFDRFQRFFLPRFRIHQFLRVTDVPTVSA